VIPATFDRAMNFKEGVAAVKQGELWGYINLKGEWILKPQYQKARNFSEGLGLVKINGKYGYVRYDGSIAIQPIFDEAQNFQCELARVRLGKKKGYIRYNPPIEKELVIDKLNAKPSELTKRSIGEGQTITLLDKSFTIKVYDHKKIDGDIISLAYNGAWLLREHLMASEPVAKKLEFNPVLGENYLLLNAKNLGREPPNTAAIIIESGGQTQKVILNANLHECDVLYFELAK